MARSVPLLRFGGGSVCGVKCHGRFTEIERDSLLEDLRHRYGRRFVALHSHLLCRQSYSTGISLHFISRQLWIVHGLALCSLSYDYYFLELVIARQFDVAFHFSGCVAGWSHCFMEAEKDAMTSKQTPHVTRDGRSSSASRFTSFGPACLSFYDSTHVHDV